MTIYDDSSRQVARAMEAGDRILFTGAAAGCVIAVVNDLHSHNGISHTWGAVLVVVSTAVLVLGSITLTFGATLAPALRVLLTATLLLDLLGTALASYFLDSTWVMVAMAVSLAGWIIRVWFSPSASERKRRNAALRPVR